jgi:bifunctional DNA-binding transcriptional regulator/antitoxin component of YhaV-PrlF toxin-antitoxin module
MALKAKIRRIGTSLGIIIPKETLETMNMREGDTVIIPRIETPVREIRGILKGTGILFEREHADRDENIDQAFTHKNKKP